MNANYGHAQTSESTTAKTDIVAAFNSIQKAQQQGASNSDLLPLINQLNLAIQDEDNATILETQNPTQANEYAQESISLSTAVSTRAQQLGNAAQGQSTQRQALAYLLTIVIAVTAAVLIVESPRAKEYLAKRRLRKGHIVYGGGNREE